MSSGRYEGHRARRSVRAMVLTLASLACAAPAAVSRADVAIVVEPRASFVKPDDSLTGPSNYQAGAGLGVLGGLSLDYEPIVLMPEVTVNGDGFPNIKGGTFRAMAGARVGIAWTVVPSAFLHVGYGFLGVNDLFVHGFSLDTGLSLDYRVSRLFMIGGSLGYELLANGDGALHGGYIAPRIGFRID